MTSRDFSKKLHWLIRPDVLALGPGVAAGGWFFGPEGAAVAGALGVPLAILGATRGRAGRGSAQAPSGTAPREVITAALDTAFRDGAATHDRMACFAICMDDPHLILTQFGRSGYDRIMAAFEDRIRAALRDGDVLRQFDGGRFAIAVTAHRRIDIETAIQIAARLQKRLGEPVSLDGTTVYGSVSIGFCLPSRAPERNGTAILAASEGALDEAWSNGPAAIRAYTPDMRHRQRRGDKLAEDIERALDTGEIVAFFQPQLSTDTGAVTGFEALARWMHPTRGILPPAEFMPAIAASGLGGRLNETILTQALSALRAWDRAGLEVGSVAVNFSSEELRDPNLVARLKWDLDRFDLPPRRLSIEVLESVVAETDDDMIVRNLTALSKLGCGIDLDDFGTGHAAIASIRRFSVSRIKIDRSFVAGADTDPEQQKIITAILSLAEQLGVETLAEGVESLSEHALLAQLGCTHVQGFAIARPMPLQSTHGWLTGHRAKLERTPGLSGRAAS